MDQVGFGLYLVSFAAFVVAFLWFVVVAVRAKWWWLPSFFLVVPVFVFAVVKRQNLKRVGLLFLAAIILNFAGLIALGDLFGNKHPNEPATRTFAQRAFGCSGSAVWSQLFADQSQPLEQLLSAYTFDPNSLRTEIGVAQLAVHAAALSYLPPERIKTIAAFAPPIAKTTVLTVGEYQAVVITIDDVALVAFRGTDNARNWVKNFKFVPAQTALGWVHAGFRDGFRELWPQVTQALAAARDKNQPIWLTGHSLGGAIALLAAAELQTERQPVAGVITFGQPPVGFPEFTERWEALAPGRLVRYVNHRDAVVAVSGPIALPWASLTHTGRLRYFDTTGRRHDKAPQTRQMLRDAVCAPLFESGAEFNAHYIRRYLGLVMLASNR